MSEDKNPGTVSKSTLTPLGNLIGAVLLTGGIAYGVAKFDNRLQNIERIIEQRDRDLVVRQDVETWIILLRQMNLNAVTVPDLPD